MSSEIRFNIVFVPGTVKYLRLAVLTLLRYSPCRYRLVSNGLVGKELDLLREFADTSQRLELLDYPTCGPLEHGKLLTLLAFQETSEFFCFMDADIFAGAPFAEGLEELIETSDVLFSCSPPLRDPNEVSQRSTHAPCGHLLSSPCLAVYRNELLQKVMAETGVGFDRYRFTDQVPPRARLLARRLGWNGQTCDTGKMICLVSQAYGARVLYPDLESLSHIGGLSWWLFEEAKQGREEACGETFTLTAADFSGEPIADVVERDCFGTDPTVSVDALRRQRRSRAARYAAFYLQWLFGDAPKPGLQVKDPQLRSKVESYCSELERAFRQASHNKQIAKTLRR